MAAQKAVDDAIDKATAAMPRSPEEQRAYDTGWIAANDEGGRDRPSGSETVERRPTIHFCNGANLRHFDTSPPHLAESLPRLYARQLTQ